jgi:uncharacterized protein YndB with AHSA1/START domain
MESDYPGIPADQPVIIVTREFSATRETVWEAWTRPELMARWWGPHGFINPVCELDVREGGRWRIEMQGPDGRTYPSRGAYRAVSPPERLVYTDEAAPEAAAWGDKPPPGMETTVELEDLDRRTRLTATSRFASFDERDRALKLAVMEGFIQAMERLDELVDPTDTGRTGVSL